MKKLILNTTNEFEINGYNRYTDMQGDEIRSNANVTFANADEYDDIRAMSETTITDLKITVDGTVIYHLNNISAKFTNINETLDGDVVRIYANIAFSSADA